MQLFVVYGRDYTWHGGVYDDFFVRFPESPLLEVFSDFESAYAFFEKAVKNAYADLCENENDIDNKFVNEATEDDLFSNYNGEEELEENEVYWEFWKKDGENAFWCAYAPVPSYPDRTPILPCIEIKKIEVK